MQSDCIYINCIGGLMSLASVEAYRASLEGKRILVVGLGKSGKAAVKALAELHACVSVQDSAPASKMDPEFKAFLDDKGFRAFLAENPEDPCSYDMMVLSPGVPIYLDWVNEARDGGVEIVGELELAYRISRGRYVAITGTNGKTTTTTLTGEIFKASGRKTSVVGNIGNAVITAALDSSEDDWMVAEVSSFQLETTSEFRPVVSAMLNLTPDHLNRHKTMEAYGEAKARAFANQDESEYLVINLDDEASMKLTEGCRAKLAPFSRKKELDFGAYLADGELIIRDEEGTIHPICRASDLQIIGDHNVENALAAAAVAFFAGIDAETIGEAVKAFPGVEHRIEYSGTIDGVKYYNDSKGTNVDAAVIALKALRENIILIAGGDGKAQDFTELAEAFEGKVKALVLLGRDAAQIEACARKAGFTEIYNEKDMEACVAKARELACTGDKVLLSPACASWDMYPNYEVRGEHFKKCVSALAK